MKIDKKYIRPPLNKRNEEPFLILILVIALSGAFFFGYRDIKQSLGKQEHQQVAK